MPAQINKNYKALAENGKVGYFLRSILYLLELDQETYMPSGAIELRANHRKLISELRHKQMTSAKVRNWLEALTNATDLTFREQASVREMRRDFERDHKLKSSFICKMADTTTLALHAWKHAKEHNSFREFAPHLKKIVQLCQKKAEFYGYKDHPYDALLDEYEPGMTVSQLDTIFGQLKEKLIYILNRRMTMKENKIDTSFLLNQHYSISHQKDLSKQIIQKMGIPETHFHLAETAHPFCLALGPSDIRMTTHFSQTDFRKAYFATIHECGHGLYEYNLPEKHIGTPLAEAASFGVHESQSRFWECFIGHSHPFWKDQYPKLKESFKGAFDKISLDHFVQSINTVNPSFIRIFADEVSYGLHIILRYELEKGLIEGSLQVKDIPKMWNQKMKEMLGITPKTHSDGCLQDIHWSLGAFGYFPSYALGNLYAGALYVHMMKTHTSWEHTIASGNFTFLGGYLKEKVHKHGRCYLPVELIENATEKKFSASDYISYLEGKYL